MPDEPLAPLPKTTPPQVPGPRLPVPGWMWATFGLGLIPVGAVIGMAVARPPVDQLATTGLVGAVCGLFLGLPMLGGLALAARFFQETGARVMMGFAFAVLMMVGLGGVLFAGCMCLTSGMSMH